MKRFHSPLTRVLRLREQTERMARLAVSRVREDLNVAEQRVADARSERERRTCELEARLSRPGASYVLQQAQLELAAASLNVQQRILEQDQIARRLDEAIEAYHASQRDREIVERVVARHRDEHRRNHLRAAAVELQDWSLRPKTSLTLVDAEDSGNA